MRVHRRGVGTVIGTAIFLVLALLIGGLFVVIFNEYAGYEIAVKGFDAGQQAKGLDNAQITGVSFGSSATRGPYDARNGPTVASPLLAYNYTNRYQPVCSTTSPYYSTLCHTASLNPPSTFPQQIPFPLSFSSQSRFAEFTPVQNENFTTSSDGWTSDVFYPAGQGVSSGLSAGFDPTDTSSGSTGSPSGAGVIYASSNINPSCSNQCGPFTVEWKYEAYIDMSTFGVASPCTGGCPNAEFSYSRFMSQFYNIPELKGATVQFFIQDPLGNNYTIPIPTNPNGACLTGELCFGFGHTSSFDSSWVESTGINMTALPVNNGPSVGNTIRVFLNSGFYILTDKVVYTLLKASGSGSLLQEARMFFDDMGYGLYYHANVIDETLEYIIPTCLTATDALNETACPNGTVTGESPTILSQLTYSFSGSASSTSNIFIFVNEFSQVRPVGTGPSATFVFDWNQIGVSTISNGPFNFKWNNGIFDVRLFVNQNKLVFGNTAIPPVPVGAVQIRFYLIQPRATNPSTLTLSVSTGSTAIDSWPNQNHVTVGFVNFSNLMGATSHLVSLWIINATSTVDYNTGTNPQFNIYLRPGETYSLPLSYHWSTGTFTFILVTSTGSEYTFMATSS